jgi:anti-sigma regulatory factor (Ser/Thr protein kinase)
VSDATEEVFGALVEYFPSAIARAVLRATLRRGRLAEDRLDDEALPDFVEALERTLPMYIVDSERRGECIEKVRRLVPESRRSPAPASVARSGRDTPRRVAAVRPAASREDEPVVGGYGDRSARGVVRVRSARDVVEACDLARQVSRAVGFNPLDQTKVATAASELARNILLYAGDGEVRVGLLEPPRRGIQIVAVDSGPGIPDVDRVMSSGYRSRTGMGMGLKGAKRLMDELEIDSRAGMGTTVVAKKLVS